MGPTKRAKLPADVKMPIQRPCNVRMANLFTYFKMQSVVVYLWPRPQDLAENRLRRCQAQGVADKPDDAAAEKLGINLEHFRFKACGNLLYMLQYNLVHCDCRSSFTPIVVAISRLFVVLRALDAIPCGGPRGCVDLVLSVPPPSRFGVTVDGGINVEQRREVLFRTILEIGFFFEACCV